MAWNVKSWGWWLSPIAAVALGCAVGDSGGSFTGGNLTFGGPSMSDGTAGDAGSDSNDDAMDDGSDGATSQGSGSADDGPGDSGSAEGPGCTPSEEVCDGQDNDCDGAIDNGDPGAGQACESGMPGVCADGTTVCEGGAIACIPNVTASAELCNGLDDDCNGMIDDGNPEGGAACSTGMPGVCADGISECMVGALGCIPNETASAEVCDNQDNDCNGQVDDGNPGGGGACNTGLSGICSAGTQTCSGGVLSCEQNQMAAVDEVCNNGLDDDCNGMADDGCGGLCAHDICLTGVALDAGCDPCVAIVCAADPFCCSTSWDGLCVMQVTSDCGIPCP